MPRTNLPKIYLVVTGVTALNILGFLLLFLVYNINNASDNTNGGNEFVKD